MSDGYDQQEHQEVCYNHYDRVCQNCGREENIHVHHRNGKRKDNQPSNLIPLCRSCHFTVHGRGDVDGLLLELRNELPEEMPSSPGDTQIIRASESAWKYINAHKDPGDSFADALDKIIDEYDQLKYETEEHRVAGAKPTTQPTNDE